MTFKSDGEDLFTFRDMRVQDIRISNIISIRNHSRKSGAMYVVSSIASSPVEYEIYSTEDKKKVKSVIGCKDAIQIEITAIFLSDTGFIRIGNGLYWKDGIYLKIIKDSEKPFISIYNGQSIEINCLYIDQLQNMYHDITGDELKINI